MLRAWLLMNLDQDSSGNLKWRINVQNIYDAYKHDLGIMVCSILENFPTNIASLH